MSIPDALMRDYYVLLTDVLLGEVEVILNGHPREAKVRLAREIVTVYHSAEAADLAAQEFDRVFREKALPDEVPAYVVPASDLEAGKVWIIRLLAGSGLAPSTSEARRLVKEGAVSINGVRAGDIEARIEVAGGEILKVGKRKFARLQKPGA